MRSLPYKIAAVLTAMAVLAVAATCTPSGCLLGVKLARIARVPHACCESVIGQNASDHSLPIPAKSCPTCHQTLFAGNSVAQVSGQAFLCLAVFDLGSLPASLHDGSLAPKPFESPPDPPLQPQSQTLLGLSCAFLF